jgi:acyl carrier protein
VTVPLSFEAYARKLLEMLGIDEFGPELLQPGASLVEDIGLDSMQVFQVMIFSEALADALVPPDFPPLLFSLHDAYQYYVDMAESEM